MKIITTLLFLITTLLSAKALSAPYYESHWLRLDAGYGGAAASIQISNHDDPIDYDVPWYKFPLKLGDGWQFDLRSYENQNGLLTDVADRQTREQVDTRVNSISLLRSFSHHNNVLFMTSGIGVGVFNGEFAENCQFEQGLIGGTDYCDINNRTTAGLTYNGFVGFGKSVSLGLFANGAITPEGNLIQAGISLALGRF